ncbi:MAG: SusD/RagB family nutrient-binding outer membrane lipoprotein [Bacteroidales bacterium]
MKKLFNILLAVLMAGILLNSCTKLEDFGDTNDDPSVTPTPITAALLTNALSQIGGFATITRQGLYCQYFSETQYTEVSLYSLPKLSSTGNYSGILMDCQDIINNCTNEATQPAASKSGSLNNQIAIARIIKAYVFWYVTDSWGDVPYTTALTGSIDVTYETQESIYKGNITELKDAVAQFDDGPAIKGDILFSGDIAKWKKFANSMRLMMALRLSNVDPSYAQTEFNSALSAADGLIIDDADNVVLTYVGNNFKSPWYNLYDGRKDFAVSETITDLLSSLSDSRISVFGSSNIGFPYGLKRESAEAFSSANSNWARILPDDLRTQTGSVFILTASEIQLARAEAADRGWTAENAEQMFADGVSKGFTKWGLTAPGGYVDTLSNAVGTNQNLEQIAIQQYLASYPNGWSGWANWRRTGYPVLTPAPDATNSSKQIPRRYVYGDSENSLTPEALAEAVARLSGGDSQDARVWWDTPPKK